MEIHELSDFPYAYTTQDETDTPVKPDVPAHSWQNDPNHNVEPKSVVSDILDDLDKTNMWNETPNSDLADKPNVRVIPITLAEYLELDNRVIQPKSDNAHVCGTNCTTATCDAKFAEHYGYPRRHGRNREPEYKSVLRDESDKRVERFFIGQQGQIWIVWAIMDIPAGTDDPDYAHLLTENGWGMPSSDGKLIMVTAHPFLTRKQADGFIAGNVDSATRFDEETLTHTYELGQM